MTDPATSPTSSTPPTSHPKLLAWVAEVAALTTPEQIVWCDGSDTEWRRLTSELVDVGTLVRRSRSRVRRAPASGPPAQGHELN